MAQARKVGREYAITNAVTEIIHIPAGFEHAGQTIINDGTEDIFWREYDPTITYAGTIAELIAEAIGGSRLEPGESDYIASCDIVAVCSTDEQETTSTLRVAPGRLNQSGDADANTALTAIAASLAAQIPTGSTALNTAATIGVGTVDVITLTANTIYIDIKFDTVGHYATPGVAPPTTLYGAEYLPGITYRIHTFKTTNLYVESVAGAGVYHATCYTA